MNITVSIIEDDAPVRQILTGWIDTATGFHCLSVFGSAESALASLPQAAPDILLVDINLPGMNGIECVRGLKALMPKTQFLMLTVYADTDHIFNALMAGASGYLLKETGQKELIASLKLTHEGGAAMTSQIARKLVQSFQPQPEKTAPQGLTPREQAILKLLSHGDYYKEIADSLGISVHTVCTHIRHIYEKLHVGSRAQAVARYLPSPAATTATPGGQAASKE
ncbi:MAG: response regulator transcription factor [Verrucomicrobiia bacterium]